MAPSRSLPIEILRLQQIHTLVDDISSISKTLASSYEPSLEAFTEPFDRLLYDFKDEYVSMDLDEIVVGAMAPVVSKKIMKKTTGFDIRLERFLMLNPPPPFVLRESRVCFAFVLHIGPSTRRRLATLGSLDGPLCLARTMEAEKGVPLRRTQESRQRP